MNLRFLVLLAGLGAALWAFRRWRQGLLATLVLVVLEGAIRKWLLPGAQDLVYLAKDVLLLGVYGGFLRDRNRLRITLPVPPAVAVGTLVGVVFGLAQIFNPNLPNLLVGVLGLKAYFFYTPLLWVVPAAFRDDRQLARFLSRYVLLAIPIGLLALAQFVSPPDSRLNTYARGGGAGYITTFGTSTQVRVTGTFSYISGYTEYLLVTAILVLAILATTRWRYRGNWLHYLVLGLTILGMLMTGSRGPVFMLVLLFPLYLWLSLAREVSSGSMLGRALLGAGLLAVALNFVGTDAVEAFYARASTATDVSGRVIGPFTQPFVMAGRAGLLGYGIGASHQTAEAVTKGVLPYSWLRGNFAEDEPSRVMLELGPLGFLAVYFVRLALIVVALAQVFQLRRPFYRAVATSSVLVFLAHLPGAVVFNITADVYFWFFAGLLVLVMRLHP
nr:hypothetical protein [Thermoanaerobaculia bacterium]